MIRGLADGTTKKVWNRIPIRRWSVELQRAAYRKLLIIDAAEITDDLSFLPVIDSKNWRVIGAVSTAYASMTNGGFVSFGETGMPTKSKPRITTKAKRRLPPVHPGEILAEEFLKPLALTQYRLAEQIRVPRRRINEIVLGQRSITADTALRLARFFGASDRFWLNLQATYDLEVERDRIGAILDQIEVLRTAS